MPSSINPYLNNNPNSSSPVTEEKQRHLSITVKGCPIIDGKKNRLIESRWNCMLDLTNLLKKDDSLPPPQQLPNNFIKNYNNNYNHNNNNNNKSRNMPMQLNSRYSMISNNNNYNHNSNFSTPGTTRSSRSNTIFLPTGVSTPTASKSSYNVMNNKKNGIIPKLTNIPENPGIRHNHHHHHSNIDNSHNNNHKEANDGVVVSFLGKNN